VKVEDVKLRKVEMQAGVGFRCRDVYGHIVNVRIRKLKHRHKNKLMETLRMICDSLPQPNEFKLTQDALCLAMSHAAFVETRHKTMGAYTSTDPDQPFIILNEQSQIWNDPKELAVTLLHELLHMLKIMGCIKGDLLEDADKDAESKTEAVHDLLCYKLLGFGVPSDHWVFKAYPEILGEK